MYRQVLENSVQTGYGSLGLAHMKTALACMKTGLAHIKHQIIDFWGLNGNINLRPMVSSV